MLSTFLLKGEKVVIHTHVNVDLDAVASVWAFRRIHDIRDSVVRFHPASWDGSGAKPEDVILDMDAADRGVKGDRDPDGTTHSCLALLVKGTEFQDLLGYLVRFIDAQDSKGSAYKWLAPELDNQVSAVFSATGLNSVLRALQGVHRGDDAMVLSRMEEIFDGMLMAAKARRRASLDADRATLVGNVAISDSKEMATSGVLFERGARAVVYIDGFSLGIVRSSDYPDFRMDANEIRDVVAEAREEAEWYAHPAGFLYCRGSRKNPVTTKSKVDPVVLAKAVARVVG
jgi:hypothetical protein